MIPVAMSAFLDKFVLTKKAVLKAPWCPDSPPKKPLKAPPKGSHFLSKAGRTFSGVHSINAKNKSKQPMVILVMLVVVFVKGTIIS